MVEPTTDRGRKVAALAARLRVLHAELRTEDAEFRREQLRDEVNRVVAGVQPHEREKFLSELLVEFPSLCGDREPAAQTPAVKPTQAPRPVADSSDPMQLVLQLMDAAEGLSDADKRKIADKLAIVGLVKQQTVTVEVPGAVAPAPAPVAAPVSVGADGTFSEATMAGMRKAVGASADTPLSSERMADLMVIATDYMIRVENMSTTFAREIGVDAKYNAFVQQAMKKLAERYVSGDPKSAKDVVQKAEANNRILIAAVVRAVRRAGEQFAADHLTRFAPEEIDKAVGNVTFGKSGKCWEAYCAMMKGADKAAMAKRIQDLVKKEVEAWLDQFMGA